MEKLSFRPVKSEMSLNIQIEIFRYLDLNFREEVQTKDINLAGRHQNISKYKV